MYIKFWTAFVLLFTGIMLIVLGALRQLGDYSIALLIIGINMLICFMWHTFHSFIEFDLFYRDDYEESKKERLKNKIAKMQSKLNQECDDNDKQRMA